MVTLLKWASGVIITSLIAAVSTMWVKMGHTSKMHREALERREQEKDVLHNAWREEVAQMATLHKEEMKELWAKNTELALAVTRGLEYALNIPPAADLPTSGPGGGS